MNNSKPPTPSSDDTNTATLFPNAGAALRLSGTLRPDSVNAFMVSVRCRRALREVGSGTETLITMLGGAIAGHISAWGHDLRPGDPSYRFQDYEAIVNRNALVRQVYEWPNIANSVLFANIRNGLNGFQFSYDVPPDELQIIVQAYSSANAATY